MFTSDFYRNYRNGWPDLPTARSLVALYLRAHTVRKDRRRIRGAKPVHHLPRVASCNVVEKIRDGIRAAVP